jgi:hypothetical protein
MLKGERGRRRPSTDVEAIPQGHKWLRFHAPKPHCACKDVSGIRAALDEHENVSGAVEHGVMEALGWKGWCDRQVLVSLSYSTL